MAVNEMMWKLSGQALRKWTAIGSHYYSRLRNCFPQRVEGY